MRYIEWVNAVAKAHWLKNATPPILENYFWVLISHTIQYKKAAVLNDVLLLKTYVIELNRITSIRMVNIYNTKTNALLVTFKTKWCFMSVQTKKPARITDAIINLFN